MILFGSLFLIQMYLSLLIRGNWDFVAKVEAETVGYMYATQTEIFLVKFLSITTLIGFLFKSVLIRTIGRLLKFFFCKKIEYVYTKFGA